MMHMNQGQGETSYAVNSSHQNAKQERLKPLIEAAIIDLCSNNDNLSHGKVVIADLGCSSGPNALVLVSTAVKAIHGHFLRLQQSPPEVCVLLNDLPDNDFNMVVKILVTLRRSHEPVVTVGITPGSLYERLFMNGSLHLMCSSYCLHWLSKSPEVLIRNRIPAYDIDEDARLERLLVVHEAYAQQFRSDFTNFLDLRAKELVSGGRLVVSLLGRTIASKSSHIWEGIVIPLSIMVSEGVIDKDKFHSFYLPMYGPSNDELREIIQAEGSFSIMAMQVHGLITGTDSAVINPSRYMKIIRAVFEQLIFQHFGDVMDEVVRTGEQHFSLDGRLHDLTANGTMLVVSLTKA